MIQSIIEAFPKEKRKAREDGSSVLRIAECFTNSIQGENFAGYPATFLRLQGCVLNCSYCDTAKVQQQGNPYSVDELIELWEITGAIYNLSFKNQHLVLTGGSPLLQQKSLYELLTKIQVMYRFQPFVEIENECVIEPTEKFCEQINMWNNSPKLNNSSIKKEIRYKPKIIKKLSELDNSWFKFVVDKKEDWPEIEKDFLDAELITEEQVVLMPKGQSRAELQKNYNVVVDLAIEKGVRFSDRLQISIWNKTIGV